MVTLGVVTHVGLSEKKVKKLVLQFAKRHVGNTENI